MYAKIFFAFPNADDILFYRQIYFIMYEGDTGTGYLTSYSLNSQTYGKILSSNTAVGWFQCLTTMN